MELNINHISAENITQEQFEQIYNVEINSDGSPYEKEELKDIVCHLGNDNFLCLNNNDIIGFATLNPNSKRLNGSIYLINISVHKDAQRQGVGSKIIEFIFNYYKSINNNNPFTLHVEKSNVKAFNLYRKYGFSIIEEDNDDYLMSKHQLKNDDYSKQ